MEEVDDAIGDLDIDAGTVTADDRFQDRSTVETPSAGGR
jgi:hypothetical protein